MARLRGQERAGWWHKGMGRETYPHVMFAAVLVKVQSLSKIKNSPSTASFGEEVFL